MRARWSDSAWLPPAREVNPNDNQLSVLARLSSLNYNLLAFDMGVWGPFAARRERHFQLTTFQLNSRGRVPIERGAWSSLLGRLDAGMGIRDGRIRDGERGGARHR